MDAAELKEQLRSDIHWARTPEIRKQAERVFDVIVALEAERDRLAATVAFLIDLRGREAGGAWRPGVLGTCYECPHASPPLDRSGREAVWASISNDPTESYFRCSLPGRDNEAVLWGEYAPCTVSEWIAGHRAAGSTDSSST